MVDGINYVNSQKYGYIDGRKVSLKKPTDSVLQARYRHIPKDEISISEDALALASKGIPAGDAPLYYEKLLAIHRSVGLAPNEVINAELRPKVSLEAARKAAARVSKDVNIQNAIVELSAKEAIIVRTKEDALPILKKQYEDLSEADKRNLYVLNINPQENNGMPKSNTLISNWYMEANGIDKSRLITVLPEETGIRSIHPSSICEDWKQGTKECSDILKRTAKIKPEYIKFSVNEARDIIDEAKKMSGEEALEKFGVEGIAKAIKKIESEVIGPCKNGGYTSSLAAQIKKITEESDETPCFVIPDDCSLSGSSILCDTARIVHRAFEEDPDKEVHFVFSPMILGDKAQKMITRFNNKDALVDESFLVNIHALFSDGNEKFTDARKSFSTVQNSKNIKFSLTNEAIRAQRFTDTNTFRALGRRNFALQQKLLFLMQGPKDTEGRLYGGFEGCGVMVVTPTETFEIDGKKYAGKVPTDSVGFMEILGQASGVLNDDVGDPKGKGLFTKGTGKQYYRYGEWAGLAEPSLPSERISVRVKNGKVIKLANDEK